eukprot:TRINITY_DN29027_c0_g1_i6.p1 TRINITY_DN29027_c0_g1~~TRINITY_DN29027_c0_g1_i6.p1  ORF type:complete len:182 (-),score=43.38 TRINITY_DN29027_c0_g1_i6:293-838(-)
MLRSLVGSEMCIRDRAGDAHIRAVVEQMKADGITRYAVIGFCLGGLTGFKLSANQVEGITMVCGASPHPSVHAAGEGTLPLARGQSCPWALFPCGEPGAEGSDSVTYDPPDGDLFKELEALHPGQNLCKRLPSMFHGFVTRGAIGPGFFLGEAGEPDVVRGAIEETLNDIIQFYKERGLFN